MKFGLLHQRAPGIDGENCSRIDAKDAVGSCVARIDLLEGIINHVNGRDKIIGERRTDIGMNDSALSLFIPDCDF